MKDRLLVAFGFVARREPAALVLFVFNFYDKSVAFASSGLADFVGIEPAERLFEFELEVIAIRADESDVRLGNIEIDPCDAVEVVVLNCCVTETKDASWASNTSTILAKSARERVSRSTL